MICLRKTIFMALRICTAIIFFTVILFCFSKAKAEEPREHFRGGMFPHAGFLYNDDSDTKIQGFCVGIGGKIVFPVSNHFRVGTEGYVTSYNYKNNEGFYKLGWGGLLFEYVPKISRLMPVLGVAVGGGGIKDLYPVSGNYKDNEYDVAIYKKYSTMVIAPQVSLEYKLTSHINLATKIDYLLYPGNEFTKYIAHGPRVYFGVLFSR